MDRITKHDLERRVRLLNRYLDDDAYALSWPTAACGSTTLTRART